MSNPILIVEDNDDLLYLFKLVLESAGYQVATASNGRDALDCIERVQPRLVVMDIMMPEINGLQVARNIKQTTNYESIPILLVSAIDRLNRQEFQQSKADGILYKPFDIDELIERVGELTTIQSSGQPPFKVQTYNAL